MTRSKECFKCKTIKPLTEFYKHKEMADGHLNKCKECTKNDANKHRQENLEKVRAYDRERSKLPHRIKLHKEVTSRWKANYPERIKAQRLLSYAVKIGAVMPHPCWVCGEKAEAHHPDYSAPLDVVWLCHIHHSQTHALVKNTS
jgi:hypothetical protein